MVCCYGTTEYSEDMKCVKLYLTGKENMQLDYEYKCREMELENADEAYATISAIKTRVGLKAEGPSKKGYVKEGYAFSPMLTLGYTGTLKNKEVFTTWLSLARED